jgi:DEAD/DEAH box helicase domain-containing protein
MSAPAQASRVKLGASFWSHDLSLPLGSDLSPASLFQKNKDFLIVDIETKTLVDAVGGWKNFKQLEVSIACAYDSRTDEFLTYRENELAKLAELCKDRLVIGYNVIGFDLPVLEKYGVPPISELDVFDIMLDFQNVSGWKFVKLEKIAQATLGTGKSADGIMAVEWWKTGEVDKIIEYCLQDVKVTRDVFLHGLNKGFLEVMKADESKAKFNVNWS